MHAETVRTSDSRHYVNEIYGNRPGMMVSVRVRIQFYNGEDPKGVLVVVVKQSEDLSPTEYYLKVAQNLESADCLESISLPKLCMIS